MKEKKKLVRVTQTVGWSPAYKRNMIRGDEFEIDAEKDVSKCPFLVEVKSEKFTPKVKKADG